METNTATLWELWVDPVRRGSSPSTRRWGASTWPFRAGSCSSAASTSTPRSSTGINREEALAFARTSSCTSKTVSRVLYQTVIYLDASLPIRSSHPGSGRASLGGRTPCSHTGVAPDRVYSDGQSPAVGCALTAPFHPYLVVASSISFASALRRKLTHSAAPPLPKRTASLGSFRSGGRGGAARTVSCRTNVERRRHRGLR